MFYRTGVLTPALHPTVFRSTRQGQAIAFEPSTGEVAQGLRNPFLLIDQDLFE